MAARHFTLGALAAALGAALEGDPDRVITGVAPLESAGPDHIAFLTDPRYRDRAKTSRAGALLVPLETVGVPAPTLRTATPQHALIDLLLLFHPPVPPTPGIHPTAVVASDARVDTTAAIGALAIVGERARIGASVRVHPLVYVGADVEVGEGSELYPHVVVWERVSLGRRVIVHAGAVIGSDGFGYVPGPDGHRKIHTNVTQTIVICGHVLVARAATEIQEPSPRFQLLLDRGEELRGVPKRGGPGIDRLRTLDTAGTQIRGGG